MLPVAALCLLAPAADLDEAQELYRTGQYRECLALAIEGAADPGVREEEWHTLHLESLRVLGECEALGDAVDRALEDCDRDLAIRLVAHGALRSCGQLERAQEVLEQAHQMGRRYDWRYRSALDQVSLGRIDRLRGADARELLETYFRPAKQDEPDLVAARVAIAELALSKHDYALAAQELRAALEETPEDPDLIVMLARAVDTSDPGNAALLVDSALQLNPNHPAALSMAIDNMVAGDLFTLAESHITRLLDVDAGSPEAWAWRAVIAHLAGDDAREKACRETALARSSEDPLVDHLIGRELSQKYRFAEAAAAQRRALEKDPDHLDARFHLAQDLLRLGQETEGWQMAEEVLAADPYHVVAYNLMVLHDVLVEYATLERDGVIVRMAAEEAAVYGERVLELALEAKRVLGARYQVTFEDDLVLELFAQQSDFAIRTFGLPGGEGFLGVCFGNVVTMKSPVTQGADPANWEAVLWHELCHAVTLNKTRNRMPRWLSEGISVYEERLRDPSFGQEMLPGYQARILGGQAHSIALMADGFRRPEGALGLLFAYYESSLAVEYLVEAHGFEGLLAVLEDLGAAKGIDAALARFPGLEAGFDAWRRSKAEAWYPSLTWDPVEFSRRDVEGLKTFVDDHTSNAIAHNRLGEALLEAQAHAEASAILQRSIELCPDLLGPGCAYDLLARLAQATGAPDAELEVLDAWLAKESDALAARLRRMQLRSEREEWPEALDAAQQVLAVQPMLAAAHRVKGRAAQHLDRHAEAIEAGRAQLALNPVDPARVHYLIAKAALALGERETARREILEALEEAPRFREAHALLLELHEDEGE